MPGNFESRCCSDSARVCCSCCMYSAFASAVGAEVSWDGYGALQLTKGWTERLRDPWARFEPPVASWESMKRVPTHCPASSFYMHMSVG